MCLLQGNRSWYASATDHAGTWRWPALCGVLPQVQFLDKAVDMPVASMTGAWVVSAENCGIRSCSADIGVDVPVVQVVDWVSCLEVPQIQFIARVCGFSSVHREWGFQRGFGGDVGLGIFSRSSGSSRS